MNAKKKNVERCLDTQPMQTTTTCNVCIFFAKFGNIFLKGKKFKDMIGKPFNIRSWIQHKYVRLMYFQQHKYVHLMYFQQHKYLHYFLQ
jgi:hypothetical protein